MKQNFDIRNCASKLCCFGHYYMKNRDSTVRISKIKMRILKWYFDIQNCELRVNFDIENMVLGNIPNAKVDLDHNNMKNSYSPNIEIKYQKSKIKLTSEIESQKSKIKLTSEIEYLKSKIELPSEIESRKLN